MAQHDTSECRVTEKDLLQLGFSRVDVPEEEADGEVFYYYEYNITRNLSLISDSSDQVESPDKWEVELFDEPRLVFKSVSDIIDFIRVCSNNLAPETDEDIS